MSPVLHITNGDSAGGLIQESDIGGDVLSWRDVLHEGPVPGDLILDDLSVVRAEYLAATGLGDLENLKRDFAERDNILRRFADYDEVVLADAGTDLSLIAPRGYLGNLPADDFPVLMDGREPISRSERQILEAVAQPRRISQRYFAVSQIANIGCSAATPSWLTTFNA